jgi:5-methylcytosine-specific restriction endonuclease McrA
MSDLPSTKTEAKLAGATHFFTGLPCRHGHVAKRYVHNGACIECASESTRKHRAEHPGLHAESQRNWRKSNPEGARAQEQRYRERHPERCRARAARKNREYCQKHPERVAQYRRKWREANPDVARACTKRWQAENPEKTKANAARWKRENPEKAKAISAASRQSRRARKRAAEGRFTAADVLALKTRQKGKCACCGKKRKLAVDHIVPLAKGGSNWPNNLQLLCTPCNASKSAKDPIAFMQEKGMLL